MCFAVTGLTTLENKQQLAMEHHYLRTLLRAYELNKQPKLPSPLQFISIKNASIEDLAAKPLPFNKIDNSTSEGINKFLRILSRFGVASGSLPQFSKHYRGFAILNKDKLYPQKWFNYTNITPNDFEFYCNPLILSVSGIVEKNWEYCASFDAIKVAVPRSLEIEVSYVNRELELKVEQMRGFQARLFQHEYDHLLGNLLNQYMSAEGCEADYNVQSFFELYAKDFDFENPEGEEPYTEQFKQHYNRLNKSLSEQFYGDSLDPNHIVV